LLVPQLAFAFNDSPRTHVHADAIEYVRSEGIVTGYPDGSYRPDAQINRAEFTKIVVEATRSPVEGSRCFPDVTDEWFARYVCAARSAGIVSGYPDGMFRPANPISFVEAAKVIGNAFEIQAASGGDEWYEPYVLALEGRKAIPLEVQSLDQAITRGQMAEIIYRLRARRTDKSSRTLADLTRSLAGQNREGEQTLVELPIPLSRYTLFSDPVLQVDRDGKNHVLVLPVDTSLNDRLHRSVLLYVNGKDRGAFSGVTLANVADEGGEPLYVTFDGVKYSSGGLPKFKQIDEETVARAVQRMQSLYSLDAARAELSEYLTGEDLERRLELFRDQAQEHIESTEEQLNDQLRQPAQDLSAFLDGDDSIRAIMGNNVPGNFVVVISPAFGKAEVLHFKDGALTARHRLPLYVHVAQNKDRTRFLYLGEVVGDRDEADVVVLDDGMEVGRHAWTTQPQYGANDEVMYMTMSSMNLFRDSAKVGCKAVIGQSQADVRCNDRLFLTVLNHPFYRFPMSSPDGKTVVYPELVSAGEYGGSDYPGIVETAPTSRLVVNGEPQSTHPYIDKPFFTSRGLAVLSNVEKPDSQIAQYVEWDGKKSEEFQAIGTGLVDTFNFRGVSTLVAAISWMALGDLGVDELTPEVVVSPDGKSIAFAGYKFEDGWTVVKDMSPVGTYKMADQLAFSPDSKDLAFTAVPKDSEPLLKRPALPEKGAGLSSAATTAVLIDGKEIGRHGKVLWLQYAPSGALTYIGKDQNGYTLYIDGRPTGEAFDRILMPPRFNNGMIEIGGARGSRIVLVRESLEVRPGDAAEAPDRSTPTAPTANISQESIVLAETFTDIVPSRLSPLPEGEKSSETYYTDGTDVYALSLMEQSKDRLTYNLYRLEGETPESFAVLNDHYAAGQKVYARAGRFVSHSFITGVVTYAGPGVKVISNNAAQFQAVGGYATDGVQAFHLSNPIDADVASFRPVNSSFARDRYGVFLDGAPFSGPDPATFEAAGDTCGTDAKNTYCHASGNTVYKLPVMDGPTLKYLGGGIAYDKDKAVCKESVFDLDTGSVRVMQYGYGEKLLLDNERVYKFNYTCPPELLEGMDPVSLEEVLVDGQPSKVWLKDAKNVYYALKPFPAADPDTFRVLLDHEFSLDANHVFWRNEIIAGADPRTFELITDRYAKDEKNVYLWKEIVPGADPGSFSPPQ
jgi:hypothetical protein